MKLRRAVKELESIRGRHTELVSVYLSSGHSIVEMINQLAQEKSTASNIKSKSTRKNVLDALEKIIQHLRLFRQTPPNGLIVFCGNVSPAEGKVDLKLWSFEPPEKMNVKLYWCDQVFVLDPLKDLVREKEIYGLIVLDASEANIGFLKGKQIVQVKHIDSTVPGKSIKGGMSQRRYDRIREDALNEFFRKVAETASEVFLGEPDLKGVIMGGPGYTKDGFFTGDYLNYQIQNKVLGVKDVGYTGQEGLEELVKRSEDLIKESKYAKEREILKKFFLELQKNGNVAYGYDNVRKALDMGAVDMIILSEEFSMLRVKFKCQCGFSKQMDVAPDKKNQLCDNCHSVMNVEEEQDMVEILIKDAEKFGTKVEWISVDTEEGRQFKNISGIGAFLRYKIS